MSTLVVGWLKRVRVLSAATIAASLRGRLMIDFALHHSREGLARQVAEGLRERRVRSKQDA